MLYDSWTKLDPKVIFGKSRLRESVFVALLHIAEEGGCVCGCIYVWFVLCRSTCVTLWEDELRQREKKNAVVTLVFIIAQEM